VAGGPVHLHLPAQLRNDLTLWRLGTRFFDDRGAPYAAPIGFTTRRWAPHLLHPLEQSRVFYECTVVEWTAETGPAPLPGPDGQPVPVPVPAEAALESQPYRVADAKPHSLYAHMLRQCLGFGTMDWTRAGGGGGTGGIADLRPGTPYSPPVRFVVQLVPPSNGAPDPGADYRFTGATPLEAWSQLEVVIAESKRLAQAEIAARQAAAMKEQELARQREIAARQQEALAARIRVQQAAALARQEQQLQLQQLRLIAQAQAAQAVGRGRGRGAAAAARLAHAAAALSLSSWRQIAQGGGGGGGIGLPPVDEGFDPAGDVADAHPLHAVHPGLFNPDGSSTSAADPGIREALRLRQEIVLQDLQLQQETQAAASAAGLPVAPALIMTPERVEVLAQQRERSMRPSAGIPSVFNRYR
jgi:hypothetical protein